VCLPDYRDVVGDVMEGQTEKPYVSRRVVIPQCPITSGRPTKMTRSAFSSLCKRYQEGYAPRKPEFSHGEQGPCLYCAKCGGKKPKEITFYSKAEIQGMSH